MKFGILGAMDSETEHIIEKLDNRKKTEISGFEYFEGDFFDKKIVVTTCSVGKVNAAISTQIMIDNFSPDFIINTGIAGGLDERLEILSVVIGERLTYHDLDAEIMKKFYPNIEYFESDKRAVRLSKEICDEENIHNLTGTIVTGDLFVEDKNKKEQLRNDFSALCCEMEGAAIAHTATINKIPFIILRSISDMADDGGKMVYEEFKEVASNRSAKMVLNLVKNL